MSFVRPFVARALAAFVLVAAPWFVAPAPAHAQFGATGAPAAGSLVRVTADPVTVAAGGRAEVVVRVTVAPEWHVNANPPALDYNIPTTVTLTGGRGLTAGSARYPAGESMRFEFEDTPLLVYSNTFEVRIPVTAAADAASGRWSGTVEYQACDNQVCLAPARLPYSVDVTVTGGSGAAATPAAPAPVAAESLATPVPAPAAGLATSPPAGGATSARERDRLEEALARGGVAWLALLFVSGLLLNLTPCVFPMLGVTVSIFGTRAKEPLPKVLVTAISYVLGICVTYTALGVVAALTGGLFGAALQSPWVPLVLGGLMLVLSLGMFGLYELQPPSWVLDRLGGAQATGVAGAFLSGLGVGVIAAPCVGPVVVAILALVAQKGSVAFGVQTMFTLSLGLGFPYLFLAVFSGLLQSLPRSGDWMVWMKHLFGVIMAGIGLFYVALGVEPDLAPWVLPVVLALGGVWLGFLDRSAGAAGRFRSATRLLGAVAAVVGLSLGVQLWMAASRTMTWKPYTPEAVAASVAAGRPVMMDFSADWCVPCHELELQTFTDPAVVAAARGYDRYKVDLTNYESPESEQARQRYGITGVPTVVFLGAGGTEVAAARVEGFLPPEPFLTRMRAAGAR